MTITTRLVPQSKLFVSEPAPYLFGNPNNTPDDPSWATTANETSNWSKSRFHFSFCEYYNPSNKSFGAVRVLNDDIVQPQRGFDAHPHSNMEIITYVVDGSYTHKDDMGNVETLGRGSIQFMTAGTGVLHSEYNNSSTKPLRFIQTWIIPRERDLPPHYGSYNSQASQENPNCAAEQPQKKNLVHHLVSDVHNNAVETPVKINQDVNARACELESGKTIKIELLPGGNNQSNHSRQAYLLAVEGTLTVVVKSSGGDDGRKTSTTILQKHDGMEIYQATTSSNDDGITHNDDHIDDVDDDDEDDDDILEITATGVETTENGDVAHFIMFDMAYVAGSGRTDL
jgi:quercetin 2,3-dioxygenase